jgi:hypothetical protein
VKSPIVSDTVRCAAHSKATGAVLATADAGEPAPSMMGDSCERVRIRGKSDTLTTAFRWGEGSSKETRSRAVPRDERVTHASWCRTLNDVVVRACAAEGHVTVARQRSTTLSARHQVVNRWNMLLQATCGHVASRAPTTLHSQ